MGLCIGPFSQEGLNEAFGRAIGLGDTGFCPDVFGAEIVTEVSESDGFVAGASVGHHCDDADAEALVIGLGSLVKLRASGTTLRRALNSEFPPILRQRQRYDRNPPPKFQTMQRSTA